MNTNTAAITFVDIRTLAQEQFINGSSDTQSGSKGTNIMKTLITYVSIFLPFIAIEIMHMFGTCGHIFTHNAIRTFNRRERVQFARLLEGLAF